MVRYLVVHSVQRQDSVFCRCMSVSLSPLLLQLLEFLLVLIVASGVSRVPLYNLSPAVEY